MIDLWAVLETSLVDLGYRRGMLPGVRVPENVMADSIDSCVQCLGFRRRQSAQTRRARARTVPHGRASLGCRMARVRVREVKYNAWTWRWRDKEEEGAVSTSRSVYPLVTRSGTLDAPAPISQLTHTLPPSLWLVGTYIPPQTRPRVAEGYQMTLHPLSRCTIHPPNPAARSKSFTLAQ